MLSKILTSKLSLNSKFLTVASPIISSKCSISLQEYQSKKILQDNGINVQRFLMASTPDEAQDAGQKLMNTIAKELVIKAQILAGGRGRGTFSSGLKGGVKLTKDPSIVKELTSKMINHRLVTKQTKPEGVLVEKLMIAEALDIARETYFAILLDRAFDGPVMIGSPVGGVDIEEVAEKTPEKIFKEKIDFTTGITREQAIQMAKNLEFTGQNVEIAAEQITRLYRLFRKLDCTQLEINPFGETPDGRVVCFDAKLNFDDNAEFRQKEVFTQQDLSETDPREVQAVQLGLNYIQMDGNIGCMVNGAGLAMATMDIITLNGGSPANFLDCGGNVNEKQVYEAFKLLTSDDQVKAILVNIFGGIVNCATIANGIVNACKTINLKVPLIVRLQGTNAQKANEIILNSGLNIIPELDFDTAAKKAFQSVPLKETGPKKHGHSQFGVINCDDTINGIGIDWNGDDKSFPEEIYTCTNKSIEVNKESFVNEICRTPPSGYHVCLSDAISYPESVPIGGPHRPVWVTYGEYKYMPPQRWVHAIEHGAAAFLFNPCGDLKEIEKFKKMAKNCLRRHIITPYKQLPNDELFNIVTFGCKLKLNKVSNYETEIVDFLKRHAIKEGPEFHITEDGEYKFGLIEQAKLISDMEDSNICPNF
ncbi:unnamed protein product [Brachionus calyciflorus]|uniref:Succinate--CoA ligase [GDP-forming] subunit beta, mitochondrial n=1 Tax=Brachionus calyciflorus TaxID=104777 RepID=A0A813Z1T2_9BILA|nr:unnamed protein product [Brachionus calyciflorus]